MRILMIHADAFSYHVTDRTSAVGKGHELDPELSKGSIGDSLVLFCCSEKGDERGIESVAQQAAKIASGHARRVKTDTVMLYPYAHLSSHLSSPRVATTVLDRVFELLQNDGELTIKRSPFGYYKGFTIACKGHPLSELAQTITAESEKSASGSAAGLTESQAIKAESTLKSQWYICEPPDREVPAEKYDFRKCQRLKKLYRYERALRKDTIGAARQSRPG